MATDSSALTMGRLCFVGGQIGSFFIAKALISSPYIQQYNPYEWRMNILLKLIGIRVIRQSIYALIGQNSMLISPKYGIVIATYNIVFDVLSIYFTAKCKTKKKTNLDYIALGMYGLGCVLESGHDFLKSQFKKTPENHGRLYKSGFGNYLVFPNYLGFWLWHTGRALLSHNVYYTSIVSFWQFYQFHSNGIPKATKYASKKYGKEYADYRSNTYKMIPFAY
eukprot:480379_1